MIAVVGLVIGIIAGLVLEPTVPVWLEPYLPIAVVAALDAVFGGLRAVLDGISCTSAISSGSARSCPPESWSSSASGSSPTPRRSGGTC